MKTITTTILAVLIAASTFAQDLNKNASFLKKNFPTEYENNLKKHALEEWGNDFNMVMYAINQQSDALVNLLTNSAAFDNILFFDAIEDWSRSGYLSSNIKATNTWKVINYKNCLNIHVDWNMVKYQHDQQYKAKSNL